MLGTVIYGLWVAGPMSSEYDADEVWEVHWNGFFQLFTAMAYVFVVQYNLPGFVSQTRRVKFPEVLTPIRNKGRLHPIILSGVLTSTAFTAVIGIFCAWFFNGTVEPLCTLNWRFFTGIGPSGWVDGTRTWYGWIICIFILLVFYLTLLDLIVLMLPVFDLVSIFPLVAISLSSNMINIAPSSLIESHPKRVKWAFRILAAWPPIILGTVSTCSCSLPIKHRLNTI